MCPMHVVSTSYPLLSIPNVFYVPQLSLSLLSINQLSYSGFDVVFSSSDCVVQDSSSDCIVQDRNSKK